jgi:hypothetical protein
MFSISCFAFASYCNVLLGIILNRKRRWRKQPWLVLRNNSSTMPGITAQVHNRGIHERRVLKCVLLLAGKLTFHTRCLLKVIQ